MKQSIMLQCKLFTRQSSMSDMTIRAKSIKLTATAKVYQRKTLKPSLLYESHWMTTLLSLKEKTYALIPWGTCLTVTLICFFCRISFVSHVLLSVSLHWPPSLDLQWPLYCQAPFQIHSTTQAFSKLVQEYTFLTIVSKCYYFIWPQKDNVFIVVLGSALYIPVFSVLLFSF